MKVAIVHDWLTELGGAEKVLTAIIELYPDADIFTLVAEPEVLIKLKISVDKLNVSFISKLPFAKTKYRNYLPFFPRAIESFDLSSYDLVISSSYCVAKGVLTTANQVHISYCHSPVRYAWDLYHQYLLESKLNRGFKGLIAKYILHKLRIWDVISSNRVDYFIANSDYIGKRIGKVYRRKSETIYPCVDVSEFEIQTTKLDYYFTCSRLVPYKKVDLIVRAFAKMPTKKLIVIGDGPDREKVKSHASDNIELMGYQSFNVLREKLSLAKAFIFAAEEDFGIAPVEAQACGTPVIAFAKGGALETVIDGKTGLHFYEQTEESIIDAVNRFENLSVSFDSLIIRNHAEKFSKENFQNKLQAFIDDKVEIFRKN